MCLNEQMINSFIDNELQEPWISQIQEHLNSCAACRKTYESLLGMKNALKSIDLSDQEISESSKKVHQFIHSNKEKDKSFLKKHFSVSLPMMVTAAAAFVVVFVGAFFFMSDSDSLNLENIPSIELNQNASLVPVSDNLELKKDLSTYSVDQIVKELENRGFSVHLDVKEIQVLP